MVAVMSVAAAAWGTVFDGVIPPVETVAPRTSEATATRENRRAVIPRSRGGFCGERTDCGREENNSGWGIQAYLSKRVVSARWSNDAGRGHW